MKAEPDGTRAGAGQGVVARTPKPAATGTALVSVSPQPGAATARRGRVDLTLWGAGMVVALGLGAVGVRAVQTTGNAPQPEVARVRVETSAQALHRLEDEVTGLRNTVDALKQDVDRVRSSSGTTLAQWSARIEKADHESASRLAEVATRIDKLEPGSAAKPPDAAARAWVDVQNRLERIERQVSSPAATGTIPPVSHTASASPVPAPASHAAPANVLAATPAATVVNTALAARASLGKADPGPVKPVPAVTWMLRDVYDGLALVEGRGGALREVAPGEHLPGMGEVRSIERRGRAWVVLTSRGAIE